MSKWSSAYNFCSTNNYSKQNNHFSYDNFNKDFNSGFSDDKSKDLINYDECEDFIYYYGNCECDCGCWCAALGTMRWWELDRSVHLCAGEVCGSKRVVLSVYAVDGRSVDLGKGMSGDDL